MHTVIEESSKDECTYEIFGNNIKLTKDHFLDTLHVKVLRREYNKLKKDANLTQSIQAIKKWYKRTQLGRHLHVMAAAGIKTLSKVITIAVTGTLANIGFLEETLHYIANASLSECILNIFSMILRLMLYTSYGRFQHQR